MCFSTKSYRKWQLGLNETIKITFYPRWKFSSCHLRFEVKTITYCIKINMANDDSNFVLLREFFASFSVIGVEFSNLLSLSNLFFLVFLFAWIKIKAINETFPKIKWTNRKQYSDKYLRLPVLLSNSLIFQRTSLKLKLICRAEILKCF